MLPTGDIIVACRRQFPAKLQRLRKRMTVKIVPGSVNFGKCLFEEISIDFVFKII